MSDSDESDDSVRRRLEWPDPSPASEARMGRRRSAEAPATAGATAEAASAGSKGKRVKAPTRSSLTIKNEKFNLHDFVLVKVEGDAELGVARIKRIRGTSDQAADTEVEIQWHYRPVDTFGGPRPFYGRKEVFRSHFYQFIPAESISCLAYVHTLKAYMALGEDEGPTDFFARWTYNPATRRFLPTEVEVYCTCTQPFNPDRDWLICGQCAARFHADCVGVRGKAAVAAARSAWTCEACAPKRRKL